MKLFPWSVLVTAALGAAAISLVSACRVSIPKGAEAVRPFNKEKYLGKWFEIARMDFRFERNLAKVTATYSLNPDGTIRVDNRGYHVLDKKWKQSIGKAKFVHNDQEARLKVSFFGPFYAGYNVIALDRDYRYALVAGNDLQYLWILSRTTTVPDSVKRDYLARATALGYRVADLVWTKQDEPSQ